MLVLLSKTKILILALLLSTSLYAGECKGANQFVLSSVIGTMGGAVASGNGFKDYESIAVGSLLPTTFMLLGVGKDPLMGIAGGIVGSALGTYWNNGFSIAPDINSKSVRLTWSKRF